MTDITQTVRDRIAEAVKSASADGRTVEDPYKAADGAIDVIKDLTLEERLELLGFLRIDWYAHYVPTLPYEIDRWRRVHDKNSVHMDGCYPLYVEKLSDEMRETLETYARRET